jgi:hypothetical protein
MALNPAWSAASLAVLYMILAILYSTLEVIFCLKGKSNWIKTVTGLLIFYSAIMVAYEVCWTAILIDY